MKRKDDMTHNITQHADIQFSAGKYAEAISAELQVWQKENKVQRVWESDATLWTNADENKWTGWLQLASENNDVQRIEALAHEVRNAACTDILLMGMGGSSLCPDMMAQTFGKIADYPHLHILDSTDPLQIRHIENKIDLKKTICIVSSKSGNTLEPTLFKDYFYARLQTVLHTTEVGDRFFAITDPGTALETLAKENHFKAIFYGIPSIGGRYSALSNFGMVPSGLMGVDIKTFLYHAETMQQACLPTRAAEENPGLVLGVILGVCAKQGKNKITFIVSPGIPTLGAWLEQLLAESTGKNGKGFIPVDQEPVGAPPVYGDDRVFIYIRLTSAPDPDQDRAMDVFEQAGCMVVRLNVADKMHLGAALFCWEMATAVAGSIMGIHPFNQPDVEESKVLTAQYMSMPHEKTKPYAAPSPFFSSEGMTLFTDEKNAQEMRKRLVGAPCIAGYLQAHLNQVEKGDYVVLCAFIEMSAEHTALLQESRLLIRDHEKVATCLGFGPRFLHSTGQAYKGGPNTGVFLQITADHSEDIQIPLHPYTFGAVITAQAQADFAVLIKRARRVLRIHLGKEVHAGLERLRECLRQ
jgi:transaldolase/glucose-6-phosphate isomerase